MNTHPLAAEAVAGPGHVAHFVAAWRGLLDAAIAAAGVRFGAVAAELQLGESSFNKRRRGEVPFSVDHFLALSRRFGLPTTPEELSGRQARFAVPTGSGGFDAAGFAAGFAELLGLVAPGHIAAGACEVTVSATDIPVARVFANPALTALKLYFFRARGAGALERDGYFSLARELERVAEASAPLRAVAEAYAAIDSREVWGEAPLRSVCHQVHYLIRRRAIGRDDVREVLAQLHALVDDLHADLARGTKAAGGRGQVYRDSLFAHSPTITVEAPGVRVGLLTHDPPHYVLCRDATGFGALRRAFERRVTRAQLIGERGDVTARAYCDDLHRTVREAGTVTDALFTVNAGW